MPPRLPTKCPGCVPSMSPRPGPPPPPACAWHTHLSSLHTSCLLRYSKLMARAAEGCWYTSRARSSRSSRLLGVWRRQGGGQKKVRIVDSPAR